VKLVLTLCANRHNKGKDKAIPVQAYSGPEGSRKLGFPDIETSGT
jgi:hypothetical protein